MYSGIGAKRKRGGCDKQTWVTAGNMMRASSIHVRASRRAGGAAWRPRATGRWSTSGKGKDTKKITERASSRTGDQEISRKCTGGTTGGLGVCWLGVGRVRRKAGVWKECGRRAQPGWTVKRWDRGRYQCWMVVVAAAEMALLEQGRSPSESPALRTFRQHTLEAEAARHGRGSLN